MKIKTIAPELSVSPQLQPQDVSLAAGQGVKSIIINRPDEEERNQPAHTAIVEAASQHDIAVRYLPVTPGKITEDDVEAFGKTVGELPGHTLAFCKTGTRSATLWGLSQAGHLPTDAILKTAKKAGYDLSGLRGKLNARNA